VGEGIANNFSTSGARVVNTKVENVGTDLHQAFGVEGSYLINNGMKRKIENFEEHSENWWIDNATISVDHSTLLNPAKQTANIFAEAGNNACSVHETVTNSLLAGGGWTFYFCIHNSGNNGSSIAVKSNRIARRICLGSVISNYQNRGG